MMLIPADDYQVTVMIDFDSKVLGSSTLHYTIWKNSKQNLRLAELCISP